MGIDILGIDIMGVDILGIDIPALPLCYHVIKLQNCLFCCGIANIIVYLRCVNNLKTDV